MVYGTTEEDFAKSALNVYQKDQCLSPKGCILQISSPLTQAQLRQGEGYQEFAHLCGSWTK